MAARKRTFMEVHEALNVDRTAEGVAPAARGKWLYDNVLGAWVLSYDQKPYVPVERIETSVEIAKPIQNTALGTVNVTAQNDHLAGVFRLDRPVTFNRVQFRVNTFTSPADGRIAIYQHANGASQNNVPLVGVFDFTPTLAANETIEVAPNSGQPLTLVRGWYWMLWGQRAGAGSFDLVTWQTANVVLMNSIVTLNADDLPSQFQSNIPANTAPATIDPTVGGADVSSGATAAFLLHRLKTV